jgi:hypothetical protein
VQLEFLTPLGGLLALGALAALAAFAVAERRAGRVAAAIRLPPRPRRSLLPLAGSLAAVPALLGVAAAQPVLQSTHELRAESGVGAFVVLDISRSMLAASSPKAPSRFERATSDALAVRRSLPGVPVGIATLTNRLLPQLFPTSDEAVFARTLKEAVGVERPPPDRSSATRVTTYAPLADLRRGGYFDPRVTRRLAIVFTDGETNSDAAVALRKALLRPPAVRLILVHVAAPGERVFSASGAPEPAYRPDPASMEKLQNLARAVDGSAFSEHELGRVERAARGATAGRALVPAGSERHSEALAPFAVLAAFVPLGLILLRRNW